MQRKQESGSQLLSCLVQARPRSQQTQTRTKQPRVDSAKSNKANTNRSNQITSSSTATLKVSQFSQNSLPEPRLIAQQNLRDLKVASVNQSQKLFNLPSNNKQQGTSKKNDENVPESKPEQLYFTHGHDEEPQLSNRNLGARPSSKTELPKKTDVGLKNYSSQNILKPNNRQQSPISVRKSSQQVQKSSSKVLKKTVNLSVRESKDDESIQQKATQAENNENGSDIHQKFDFVLSKYKNCSFFSQEVPTTLFSQKVKDISDSTQTASQSQNSQQIQVKQPDSQSVVNKYITRVTRGKTFMQQAFSQNGKKDGTAENRKRMNSPFPQRKINSNSSTQRGLSPGKKQFSSAEKLNRRTVATSQQQYSSVSNPLFAKPFGEFGYHMSFLQYFHQNIVKFKNQSITQKIAKLYNNSKDILNYFDGIYKEHFLQSYHALQFCKEISKPVPDTFREKIEKLPPSKFAKTIVFDLDETLIHCNESNEAPADVTLSIQFPTGEVIDAGINVRPFCREMLATLSQQFEVIVFTASHECYASKVLDYLDPEQKLIQHRFYRESCLVVDDGLHIKDLRVLGNRELKLKILNSKDILIVDNAAYSYYFQLENGIPIIPFYDNQHDRELVYLTAYILSLTQQPNMLEKNMQYFQHNVFLQETTPESTLQKLF